MTPEQLKRGNQLARQIEEAKKNIEKAKYSQSENIRERESKWVFNGYEMEIIAPESVFKIIGKLIISDLQQQVIEMQKELDEL